MRPDTPRASGIREHIDGQAEADIAGCGTHRDTEKITGEQDVSQVYIAQTA